MQSTKKRSAFFSQSSKRFEARRFQLISPFYLSFSVFFSQLKSQLWKFNNQLLSLDEVRWLVSFLLNAITVPADRISRFMADTSNILHEAFPTTGPAYRIRLFLITTCQLYIHPFPHFQTTDVNYSS